MTKLHSSHFQPFLAISYHSNHFCHFQPFLAIPALSRHFQPFQPYPAISSHSSHFQQFPAISSHFSHFQPYPVISTFFSHFQVVSHLTTFAHKGCKIAAAKKVFFTDFFFLICSLRLNVFLPPLPKVQCPNFLDFQNPWGKVMERSGLRFANLPRKKNKIDIRSIDALVKVFSVHQLG